MTAEFEKIVLQKLDETQQEVRNLSIRMDETQQEVRNLSIRMDKTENAIKDIYKKLDSIDERVEEISHQVAVMEVELTRKVDVLFEAFTMHSQKHENYDKAIASLNAKFFNHDIRISNLEGQAMTV